VSEVKISVPWKLIFGLGPHIVDRTATSVDEFTAEVCKGISPKAEIHGVENLPENPTFILAANHYQRKGLWILFPAAIMTRIIRERYGPGDPPVRWMVTANWPRIKLGPFSFPSPGDILLPRVADALACYPVSFAGSNQAFTARSIRKILREAPKSGRPLGLFPEGVGGSAGVFSKPIPGVERLIAHLAKGGMPVVPVCISEGGGRLIFRIGRVIETGELLVAGDSADLVLGRIKGLQ
jgi:1-acyl-sn-glycerol-3-phosphate acyltransferase